MTADESHPELARRVPLGGDYWDADPGTALWGFADLHAHLMAHLAFGGRAFWGLPYDPDRPGPEGMETALSSCEPVHGGLLDVNPEFGHPAGGGWPDFIVWPRFTTLVHQQAYIDWLYRAYLGGLRLITCLAVNNELLAERSDPELPTDDKSAIKIQLAAMKDMVAFVDAQAGGPGRGWMQIAYSPEEARQIIGGNRLAVILGVEVDSLGNWHREEDLDALSRGDLNRARALIGGELDWLYEQGVRQVTPIHLANNAFGGAAIYLRVLEAVNHFLQGEGWAVENAWESGVRYRVDYDGDDLPNSLGRVIVLAGERPQRTHRRSLIDHLPGIRALYEGLDTPDVQGGHANAFGLNLYGGILLEEMMARGMIIDLDHMSELSTDQALALATQHGYPVICSHCWFRDLQYSAETEFDPERSTQYGTSVVHKVAHEAGKRGDQVKQIGRLGGIVAPILNQGDTVGLGECLPELAGKVPRPCAGSSTAWAEAFLYATAKMGGRGVAMGSDVNGAAALPGPRFGTSAAYGARDDAVRTVERRREIDRQRNGVAYQDGIHEYRWFRFEPSGDGGYDNDEANIWQAIAQYEAGFNPATDEHDDSDRPGPGLFKFLERIKVRLAEEWTDHVTLGLRLAEQEPPVSPEELADWPDEQRAAYLARRESEDGAVAKDHELWDLVIKIRAIWAQWQRMKGDNRPLERSTAGPRREFDINLDGMAHYGMMPDLLQDVRNVGLSAEDLAPLFRSANDYVEVWERCEEIGAEMRQNSPV